MKMLTGLLPASEGKAKLFGHEVDPNDMAVRRRVGVGAVRAIRAAARVYAATRSRHARGTCRRGVRAAQHSGSLRVRWLAITAGHKYETIGLRSISRAEHHDRTGKAV